MSDKINHSKIKDIGSLTITKIVESVVNGIFWLILATISIKNDYGEITFLLSISVLIYGLSKLGLDRLIIVYGSKNENIFFPSYALGIFVGVGVSIVSYFVLQNFLVSFLVMGLMLFDLMVAIFLAKLQYIRYSIFFIIRRLATLGLALFLFQFFHTDGVILGFFLANLIGVVGFFMFFRPSKIDFRILKNKTKFIFQNHLVNIVSVLNLSAIPVIIGTLFNYSILAEFQIALQFLLVVGILPSILSVYLLPQESRGRQNSKLKNYSLMLSVLLSIFSIILLPILISFFIPDYENSTLSMQIISISIIPTTLAVLHESFFLGNENSRVVLYGRSIQFSIYITLIILLGTQFGLIGLVTSHLVGVSILAIFYTISKRSYIPANKGSLKQNI